MRLRARQDRTKGKVKELKRAAAPSDESFCSYRTPESLEARLLGKRGGRWHPRTCPAFPVPNTYPVEDQHLGQKHASLLQQVLPLGEEMGDDGDVPHAVQGLGVL